ncbi:MAG TPA: ATP-binding protein [Candidatus Kapabacteria bacterium]|nr:ATP-binding protein [Candidatus Kapabacteria bacterium]
MYRSKITEKGIGMEVKLKADDRYIGYPARLQQIFWDLIKNSEKFILSGSTISIHSSMYLPGQNAKHLEDSGKIHIEIIDTGIGIEPELLPPVFSKRSNMGERARERLVGSDLIFSKNLVEAHSNTIL